ncbi:MAG: SoxR reducing system RseC family protein [Candidatus Omnitrophota bacterium]
MNLSSKSIEHQGIVSEVTADVVRVEIARNSACSSCQVKGVCSLSETERKIVAIDAPRIPCSVGDPVKVVMEESQGMRALFWGYILPFLIVISTLALVSLFIHQEVIAGALSVCALGFYYGILYLLRDRMKRSFVFRIERENKQPVS